MDVDEEPPMLVEVGEHNDAHNQLDVDMDDLNVSRVPITIITGKPAALADHQHFTSVPSVLLETRLIERDISFLIYYLNPLD